MLQKHTLKRNLQPAALVCYEIWEVCQGKAVSEMKQRHDGCTHNSAPWRKQEAKNKIRSGLTHRKRKLIRHRDKTRQCSSPMQITRDSNNLNT